ncbi:hypothetical protein H4R20_003564 [Coemansia guatemalensis]|uniref:RNI-like protein n=1 Tax=Coemansia guatemalensis TaxID=2761395 RepID=A0A9W8HTF0_9FUNG|nr:hypothetical protein H4R20_003564 [Coemansia guatemalensis]
MLAARWDLVNYDNLSRLFQFSHNLKSLDINLCSNIRSSEFERMFCNNPEMCKSLTTLQLSETKFSVSAMQKVLQMMPNLEELDLSSTMTDDGLLCMIAEHNRKLCSLSLESCSYISDIGVVEVVDACPKLDYLNCVDCPDFSDDEYVESQGILLEWDGDFDGGYSDISESYDGDIDFYGLGIPEMLFEEDDDDDESDYDEDDDEDDDDDDDDEDDDDIVR